MGGSALRLTEKVIEQHRAASACEEIEPGIDHLPERECDILVAGGLLAWARTAA